MSPEETTFEPIYRRWEQRRGKKSIMLECGDKNRYPSMNRAKWVARSMRLSGNEVHAYLCPWCSWCHVGN